MSFDLGMKYQKSTVPKSIVALNWKTQQKVHIIIIFFLKERNDLGSS